MKLEYWTITSVYKNEAAWAQLCSVKSHISDREYTNCEIITSKWQNFLPKVWDLVVVTEIHNWEIVVLWVLEPFDLWLSEWEILLHRWKVTTDWQISNYNMLTRIYVNKNNEIEIFDYFELNEILAKKNIEDLYSLLYYYVRFYEKNINNLSIESCFSYLNNTIALFPNGDDILVLKYIQMKEIDDIIVKHLKLC